VVGRGACEPASACRAAIRTHQRPEKQLRFREMVQELQRGSMNNILRQVEVQGVDAATQLGGCCGAGVEARRGSCRQYISYLSSFQCVSCRVMHCCSTVGAFGVVCTGVSTCSCVQGVVFLFTVRT
jgi:hypothetical protein